MRQSLFGTSGIRGIVNAELPPQIFVKVGLAIATYVGGGGTVALGRDTRTSSQMVETALTSGLLSGGCHVLKLGLIPTPVLAYLTRALNAVSGVMVTASHNPPEYNGVKAFNDDSMAYTEDQRTEISRLVKRESFKHAPWQKIGTYSEADEADRYVDMVLKSVKLSREWHVVLDPGCGATCHVAPKIFRELGCKTITINAQPDGFFPGRSPEPTSDSLLHLCKIVKKLGMDIGIAYDGDGDRMTVVDENGKMVPSDRLLAAYAAHVVEKQGGGTVVTHVGSSLCVDVAVESRGGRVLRTGVEDVNVASSVRKNNALFGGEPAGSWIHPKYHFCPDGILSSALLLTVLEDEGKAPSQFVSSIPSYPVLRRKVDCSNELKSRVMREVQGRLTETFPKVKEILTIDGIRLNLEDGWLLVRPSGTEPIIRVTTEASSDKKTEEILEVCVQTVKGIIKEVSA